MKRPFSGQTLEMLTGPMTLMCKLRRQRITVRCLLYRLVGGLMGSSVLRLPLLFQGPQECARFPLSRLRPPRATVAGAGALDLE